MKVVRYVGLGKNLPEEYRRALGKRSQAAVVDTLRRGNVTVRFTLDGQPLELECDEPSRDFLDLCTLIYIADEMEERSHSRDYWSRRFDIVAPVKSPAVWARHEDEFRRALITLSGDDYRFSWCRRPKLPSFGRHRTALPEGFDAVCLFSGGLDSFLGARKLLARGLKLLLVGHQADGTAASAQKQLAAWLRRKYPDAIQLVQCRVARSQAEGWAFKLPEKREETHRPRSLLFLALAVAVANAAGIESIYLPENGLIAINAPLQKSRLGSLSTRTAHPKYLMELAQFLRAAKIFRGRIENPFLFESKTDMLQRLPKQLSNPLLWSVSCARPSRYKQFKVRHCGYCVPCIYRRVAMMAAGLDREEDYAFSVFRDLSKLKAGKQLDFRALVRFAERVTKASSVEREMIVLSHGVFGLDTGASIGPHPVKSYAIWGEMLLRWSTDFLSRVDECATLETKRSLGRAGLRRTTMA